MDQHQFHLRPWSSHNNVLSGPTKLSNVDDQIVASDVHEKKASDKIYKLARTLLNSVALVKRAWREYQKKPTERR
jgi:hypothetical protein